jgi:hypothetical protein
MKKVIVLIVILFSSVFASAQSFDGVPISGDLATAIAKFKAKGYTLTEYTNAGGAIMKGKVALSNVELYISVTPKTKKVFKFSVYFDEEKTWSNLKYEYNKYYDIIFKKYGEPTSSYSGFDSPYYEGDGFEMTAVSLEKCNYFSMWKTNENLTVAVKISEFKQVQLQYENAELIKLKNKEIGELENTSF